MEIKYRFAMWYMGHLLESKFILFFVHIYIFEKWLRIKKLLQTIISSDFFEQLWLRRQNSSYPWSIYIDNVLDYSELFFSIHVGLNYFRHISLCVFFFLYFMYFLCCIEKDSYTHVLKTTLSIILLTQLQNETGI